MFCRTICDNKDMSHQKHLPKTVGNAASQTIPICHANDSVKKVLALLSAKIWDDMHYVYVLSEDEKLIGMISIAKLLQAPENFIVQNLAETAPATLPPHYDQEKAVYEALKYDVDSLPVVDKDNRLIGVVTAKSLIDIMHQEHIEDVLIATGIRHKNTNVTKLATANLWTVLISRAPWLMVGGIMGIVLGLISSQFSDKLEESIALAFFVPVVAYIADSVGTQSEAITVRALATLKLNHYVYVIREIIIGFLLGIMLGLIGLFGAGLVSNSIAIGIVVGLALLAATTTASALAALVPITFKILGKDPALASGPLATALQDTISILIYFVFAMLII